jgi:CubicO group peptidase (beta-lactamase class C family)
MPAEPTDPQSLPRTAAVLAEWTDSGHHIGAQVYVSRDRVPVADFAVGLARPAAGDGSTQAGGGPPAVPMRPDTLMLWLSAGKPVAAVALAQLRERGLLDFDDPVSRSVPEFAANGKVDVTLAHLLTHTAGLRFVETGWPEASWDRIIATVSAAPLEADWPLDQKAGYSPFASWFVLGEVVRRLDGRAYEDYVRDEIFLPLGMADSWLAMPPATYRAYGDRVGVMMNTYKKPPEPAGLDTEAAATHCRPSGGARGPARELGRFYEMMLREGATGDGRKILTTESVRLLTTPRRVGLFDHTFRQTMDWGLGFITNSAKYGPDTVPYQYGPAAGPGAFGHGGSQSTSAFADPDRGLAVAMVFNGQPGEPAHHRRLRATLAALEADLAGG